MKITDIKFEKATFRFAKPMKVAFGMMEGYDTLLLKIETDEGITGYGEAAPLGFVTGDSIDTVIAVMKEFRAALIGRDPIEIAEIHAIMSGMYAYNTAAKAGIDIACYDIASKRMGVPLHRYLGGGDPSFISDVTIGIDTPEEMAAKSAEWVQKGWTSLKVKLGQAIDLDLACMRAVRSAVGDDIVLRIDANQGWAVKDAIRIIKELEKLGVELIEQPVVAWDYRGLKEIKAAVNLPVVADESCHSPVDAAKLVNLRAVDGLNIKLMKCGGLFHAQRINAIAEANNIFCMLGCMGESRVANAAAMHFAAATKNVKVIDLDVTFYTRHDAVSGGYTNTGDRCRLLDEPGIGVHVAQF